MAMEMINLDGSFIQLEGFRLTAATNFLTVEGFILNGSILSENQLFHLKSKYFYGF